MVGDNLDLPQPRPAQYRAYGILFLASEQAAYITGETLEINGGSYMD